jgi:hypothetical protein
MSEGKDADRSRRKKRRGQLDGEKEMRRAEQSRTTHLESKTKDEKASRSTSSIGPASPARFPRCSCRLVQQRQVLVLEINQVVMRVGAPRGNVVNPSRDPLADAVGSRASQYDGDLEHARSTL